MEKPPQKSEPITGRAFLRLFLFVLIKPQTSCKLSQIFSSFIIIYTYCHFHYNTIILLI